MNEPDFSNTELLLARIQAGIGASEFHGALSGYRVAGGRAPAAQIGAALALDAIAETEDAGGRDAADLLEFHDAVEAALADEDDAFMPLLPDDAEPIAQRADCLVAWCRGFVGGIGLADIKRRGALSDDADEAINDLARIAASELSTDGDEGDEAAYAEVLEFVRVAALLLRDECREAARRH